MPWSAAKRAARAGVADDTAATVPPSARMAFAKAWAMMPVPMMPQCRVTIVPLVVGG